MAVARTKPTSKRKLTEEEFLRLPDDGRKYELVDGEAKEVPTGAEHEDIGMVLAMRIGPHAYKIGRLYGSSLGCRMKSGNVRAPDVSVIRRERLPDGKSPRGFFDGAPDLCVEVISASEDRVDAFRKVGEYFEAGAQQVWQVYPDRRRVVVFHGADDVRMLNAEDELEGGDLLPGFRCRVADLFESL